MSTEARPKKAKAKGRLMNQADVAEEFGLSRRDVIRWGAAGAGGFPRPVQAFGRTFLFSRAEMDRWAAGQRPNPG